MLVFAHRGASGHAPENTLKAIQLALDMGCDGIEIDVHQVEEELFVIHNRWLNSTTNGIGRVDLLPIEQLKALDAGDGQTIPSLRDVLLLIDGQCIINIEVKSWSTERAVLTEIDHAVEHLHFNNEQIILSSFNHHILQEAKAIRPQTLIGALTASIPISYAAFAEQLQAYSVHCSIEFINQDFVVDAHKRNLKIMVYTANEIEDIEEMLALGVDGVFTNYPTRAFNKIAHTV